MFSRTADAPVAQLDRASDYGSEGLKFESSRVHLPRRQVLAAGGKFLSLRSGLRHGIQVHASPQAVQDLRA